jgi:sugar phosphate isomerase/epimerase
MKTNQIALQLYTVREHTARDMLGTLRQIAEMGYQAVEFAQYGDVPTPDIRAALEEYGLQAVAAHVQFDAWEKSPEQIFADLHTLDCGYAVVPSVPAARRGGIDQIKQLGETFNRWGALSQSEGLQFAYHNHSFEFAPLDSTTMWDILTEATDPALVALELDVYWVEHGGHDPVEMLQRFAGRVPLLHLKDTSKEPGQPDAPVGEGSLPWDKILAAGAAAGAQWYIVEQDHPKNALEDVRTSLRNLQRMAR